MKARVAEIDPAVATRRRGAVTGGLSELESEHNREQVGAIVDATSEAIARGVMVALSPEGARLQ